jgi:hypothetical protein
LCQFTKVLIERQFEEDEEREKFDKETDYKYRQFVPIRLGVNLWLSIQASYAHYSTPRETLRDLDGYSHWEFALYTQENFVSVTEVLPDFPSLAEVELYFEGAVYPYVPTDLLEEVYLALKHY